ncbi:MAG: NAD(P)H-dependent oxidoreductase [Candidatus Marinimicrobia bacterium]|nr:NAD(P)H-dependent oxidoreductase [Candidatus Neomarinimicrobiota bacterium]
MQLTIYNGSPRKTQSNSDVLIQKFLDGFLDGEIKTKVNYLANQDKMREFVGKFQNAENIIIAFPLYADSMPGLVKEFFETLENTPKYRERQRLGFIIHCGFPDAVHLSALEKYLEKFSKRLGVEYLGSVIKPGSEGLRMMPEKMNIQLFSRLKKLGQHFRKTGEFDQQLLIKIAGKEKFPSILIPLIKLINQAGFFNFYWNMQLKKNRVYQNRFDKPYENQQ